MKYKNYIIIFDIFLLDGNFLFLYYSFTVEYYINYLQNANRDTKKKSYS